MGGAGAPVGNLPAETTSFVGRRPEVAAARTALRRHRLVTLIGGAGVGKTRLTLRIAARVAHTFPGGVWLVELAALDDGRFLPQTVAAALSVREQAARPLEAALVEFLADKELLLLLDNCEHLVEGCAALADTLLRGAPRLRILATSRQPLRFSGEQLLVVPPLPVPDGGRPDTPAQHEATRLFADRAATAMPGFTVNAANRCTVEALCRRLDGIPLAIELAAVRVRAQSPEQILARLETSYLDVLTEGGRTSLPRTQTLRAAIDWSFDLCSATERKLCARASVFSGGFDLDAAEAVCAGDGIVEEDVLELVAGLVDKSLLVRADDGRRDTARYQMPEAIRQYCGPSLAASGEETVVRARHRDYYGRLAARVAQEWLGPAEDLWYSHLAHEHANLRAAVEFCLTEPGQAPAALEIAATPWLYWVVSGRHAEVRDWLGQALDLAREASPARAKALWLAGWLAQLQADWTVARRMIEECAVLAADLHDDPALAHGTRITGLAEFFQDDLPRAAMLLRQALAGLREIGDRGGVWMTLLHLTAVSAALGDAGAVRAYGQQCLSLVHHDGASTGRSWSLWVHGHGRWLIDDRKEARELISEGLRVGPSAIDRWGTAHCLEMTAWVAAAHCQAERAARLFGAAHAVWLSTGTPPAELRHLGSEHAQGERRARSQLGDPLFAELFREGAALTPDEAVAYALD